MSKFYVMSGGTSRVRAFDRNATDLTEAEANAEAARRNKIERAAGRNKDAVLWFACPQFDIQAIMREMQSARADP